MSILSITSGLHSNAKPVVQDLSESLGYNVVTDQEIIEKTAQIYDIKTTTLNQVAQSKQIPFNDFTRDKEKGTACLRKTMAEFTSRGNLIFHGLMGHLIPVAISHVMSVLIITDKETRIKNGMNATGLPEKSVIKSMAQADKTAFLWTHTTSGKKTWDRNLYDIVIPSDKLDAGQSVAMISAQMGKLIQIPEFVVERERKDFDITASVEIALAGIGHGLLASVSDGNVLITIDRQVMMLAKFKQKILANVRQIAGVKTVDINIGKNFYQTNKVHHYNYETPMRILLVDDEKEFVQTLSERLRMRSFASEVAFSGEEALNFTSHEETDVMVLDLKMPGVDGFEVLKRIKQTKPEMEVIIMTGHGSEADREVCMKLGAFAYLQKPADIDILSDTMKRAYEKINANKISI